MTRSALQEQARALGDPTRHAIFRHIADAGRPIGIAEINEKFPLNHNAIRQHVAKLLAAGLVVEAAARPSGRGRPPVFYEVDPAVHGQWGTAGPYERLSRLLLDIIRTGHDAVDVGRRAAEDFRIPTPSGDAIADISAAMARQGFDPEVRAARGGADIVLHTCPFASAAVTDRTTVCALHLGIAIGLADDAGMNVTELVAYDPRTAECRIRLRATSESHAARESGELVLRRRAARR